MRVKPDSKNSDSIITGLAMDLSDFVAGRMNVRVDWRDFFGLCLGFS
jgi:hypothetical protein